MKTFAIFLLSKETFTIRTCSVLESFFRKLLSKATFERKLASVSLALFHSCFFVLISLSTPLYQLAWYLKGIPCASFDSFLVWWIGLNLFAVVACSKLNAHLYVVDYLGVIVYRSIAAFFCCFTCWFTAK